MADCSTIEEALHADELGFDFIGTTMVGYTKQSEGDKIEENDFAWISDAMSGSLDGSFLSNDELLGKWKGEFIFNGIWELVYVTIDTDGTITAQPYMINYGDGWGDESGNPPYIFSGSFDINRVYGDGGYGRIDLYRFIVSGGTQYGIGEFNTAIGNKAVVYLVRP